MIISEQLKIIEQNHLAHFMFLPQKFGFDIHNIHGVTVINCGLKTSMFNIAYGAPSDEFKTANFVQKMTQAFDKQAFAWWIPHSQHNDIFTRTLLNNGLKIETIEHAMICDLNNITNFSQQTNLLIESVQSKSTLDDFVSVIKVYDSSVEEFYKNMHNEFFLSQEKLFVGYQGSKAVAIGVLFISGDRAGIFSLITSDEVRGKGYGTDMMSFLMEYAKINSCRFVTLSASSDSGYRIYERLGFIKIGEFECFEYT
jgi:ribosomal protein S18 acetylase RimI-like enzyme